MSIKKTNLDIRREEKAFKLSGELIGTGVDVHASGRGYTVVLKHLNEKQMRKVIPLIVALRDRVANPSGKRKDGSIVDQGE